MALFKILKGNENNLPTTKTPGYMYITEDQGNIFVDLSTTERIQLNAKNASTSNKWAAPMKLSLTGDASGSTTFDGSNEASITVTVKDDSHNHVISNIDNLQTTLDSKASKDVATQSTNGLMSSTDKTKLNNTNVAYGTCSTAAATAAKIVTISGNSDWTLTPGAVITVKFSSTNSVPNPTLNVNNTGAKSIYYDTNVITTGSLSYAGYKNRYITYVYDGTNYVFQGWSHDANSTYSNASLGQGYYTTNSAEGATAITANGNYALGTGGIVAVKFVYDVPASATLNINSKGTKALFNHGAAIQADVIKAGDVASFIYDGTQYQLISIDRATISESGVIAGTYGPSANVTGNNQVSVEIPQITVDEYGRVTSVTNRTYTSVNTDTNEDSKVQTTIKTSGTGYVTTCTGAGTAGLNYHTSVYVNHSTGVLMGAAWNDYAEYRETKTEIEPGRVVIETGNGDLVLSQERMAPAPNVVSDTFGFAIGQTEKCNTPIAIAGRALVYPFEDRENFKAGDVVCAGPEGTVSLMTREEIKEYPDRILGIVSEIPNYETWGETNIKVNNRIWIKIK